MDDQTIPEEQIAHPDELIDLLDGVSIDTDEDYERLGELFDEDE